MSRTLRRSRLVILAVAILLVSIGVIRFWPLFPARHQETTLPPAADGPKANDDFGTSHPTIAKATLLLERADPEFKSGDFRATTTPSADGHFHSVKFLRVAGSGRDQMVVNVRVTEDPGADKRDLLNLKPGAHAPATAGVDVYGTPIGLEEYDGKVVLIVFCTPTCGPCRAFYEQGKRLVKQFEGKPFAVVEVVGCCTQDQGMKMTEAEHLPWRVLWDGELSIGPVQKQWGVEGYPTFWLIDHKGGIVGNFEDSRFIAEKVAEAEAALKK